jgi:hypothetical protein
MKSYSQACQDLFVSKVLNNKRRGTFLEIGSNHPITTNNTYLLEKEYDWKGIMVEYDRSFEPLYKVHRPNSIYIINDARAVDYRGVLDSNNFPVNMDYLSLDLDVNNRSTLDTFLLLNSTVFDKYKFATITLEHDIYTGNYFDTQYTTRDILKNRGYVLVYPDVSLYWLGGYKPFEDWYVHPDLVDMSLINDIKSDTALKVEEIRLKLFSQN